MVVLLFLSLYILESFIMQQISQKHIQTEINFILNFVPYSSIFKF